ncbi:hypothetical protein EXIGLDRAFT_719467 [Exidia glandulosa HHB12029]|uniref:Uncharacterized protein n=1 Tax=Exidia glandulosa HHB12029 TaxID=1314781 RepID=A0A165NQD8_EXIGL|nr:hypothetical protein EXIGLDRAFT_719467 [Exidia glandulosa HHB12029]
MAAPSPTAPSRWSLWLRPGNVAFIFGGAVGLASIGCQLRSSCPRGVNGLAIASAIVSLMFGVYDRTVSEKLTWTSLGSAVQEWSSGELRAIKLDVETAYGIAIPYRARGTLRDIRTLGLEFCIIRRTGTIEPPYQPENGLPPTFNDYPAYRHPNLWELVPVWHNLPTGIALYVIICSRIPLDTDSIRLMCVVCACWATSWFVTAADLHFFVVLFTVLRHFGRLICCPPFTTTICRISRDACHSATTSIQKAQLSPIVAALRLGLAAVPVTCLGILFYKIVVRIGVEIVDNKIERIVFAVSFAGALYTWVKALAFLNRIQLDTEVIAIICAGAVASLCTAPAASGFFIVVIA